MATFGISPVGGFPLPASDDFPEFIQFQADGEDLGSTDADTVNFSTGLTATRGTGENANVVTVTAAEVPSTAFEWRRPAAGPVTLVLGDLENGVVVDGASVTIPANSDVAFPDGASILLQDAAYQNPFSIVGDVGVTVSCRDALNLASAGRYALVTVIQQGIDNWIAAGDLENA